MQLLCSGPCSREFCAPGAAQPLTAGVAGCWAEQVRPWPLQSTRPCLCSLTELHLKDKLSGFVVGRGQESAAAAERGGCQAHARRPAAGAAAAVFPGEDQARRQPASPGRAAGPVAGHGCRFHHRVCAASAARIGVSMWCLCTDPFHLCNACIDPGMPASRLADANPSVSCVAQSSGSLARGSSGPAGAKSVKQKGVSAGGWRA
jgi:hypothetical protein